MSRNRFARGWQRRASCRRTAPLRQYAPGFQAGHRRRVAGCWRQEERIIGRLPCSGTPDAFGTYCFKVILPATFSCGGLALACVAASSWKQDSSFQGAEQICPGASCIPLFSCMQMPASGNLSSPPVGTEAWAEASYGWPIRSPPLRPPTVLRVPFAPTAGVNS